MEELQQHVESLTTQLQALMAQVQSLIEWQDKKDHILIEKPLDDVSKSNVGALLGNGAGSAGLTQSVAVSSTPSTITVPAAYLGTRKVLIEGIEYNIPYV